MTTSDPFVGVVQYLGSRLRSGFLTIKILASPMTQPRPRVSRNGGVYYPATFTAYRGELQRQLAACETRGLDGALAVAMEFVCSRPKKPTAGNPAGDVDNFAKAPLDMITKVGIWEDDRQVDILVSSKRYAEAGEAPHTLIHVGQLA